MPIVNARIVDNLLKIMQNNCHYTVQGHSSYQF